MRYDIMNNRKIGSVYEQAAGYYLEQQGYEILQYNYRCHAGEIDIVARDGSYIVFCEVKYRKGRGTGNALDAVNEKKQRVLCRCALFYYNIFMVNPLTSSKELSILLLKLLECR